MKYDWLLNKHFGTNHFNLRGRCFNYRKQTDHKGLSSNPKGFLDWHLCTSLAIIPMLLTSMAGQTFKNLSSSHAIKLERTSKHCGRVETPQQVNWQQILSWEVCFQSWCFQSSAHLGQRWAFLLNITKNNKYASPQGVTARNKTLLCFHYRTLEGSGFA